MPCVIQLVTCKLGNVWAKAIFVLSLSPRLLTIPQPVISRDCLVKIAKDQKVIVLFF